MAHRTSSLPSALALVGALLAAAQARASPIFVSDLRNNGGASPSFLNGDVLTDDSIGATGDHSTLFSESAFSSGNENVDAFHWVDDTTWALSTRNTATLGGVTFEDEDVVLYDATLDVASLLFDGSSVFSGAARDVDAFHVLDDGRFLLSTDGNTAIGTTAIDNDDIVLYDPTLGTASIFLDGDSIFASEENVDAVFYNAMNASLFFSTTGAATIDGVDYEDGDVIVYSAGTARTFFSFENMPGANDIDAFSAVPEPSLALLLGLGLTGLASLHRRD